MKTWTMALFTAAICVVSCDKYHPEEQPTISPDVAGVCFSADGKSIKNLYYFDGIYEWREWSDKPATFTVNISKKESWTVESNEPWVHIAKTENSFTLTANPADLVAPRPAVVSMTVGKNLGPRLDVLQEAPFSVSPSGAVVFPLEGSSKTYTVKTSQDKEWNVGTNQSWLTVKKDATNGTFTLSAAANTGTAAPPPATVTVTSGKETFSINATQEAPTLSVSILFSMTTLSVKPLTFEYSGNYITMDGLGYYHSDLFFTCYTNTKSEISITSNSSWLTVNRTYKINGNQVEVGFTVSASSNFSGPARSGTITVTAGNAPPVTIPVTQQKGVN